MNLNNAQPSRAAQRRGIGMITLKDIESDFRYNKYLYFMAIPVVLYYIIFRYGPIYGAIIAFKDFTPALGIMGSPWVGFKHFIEFFTNPQGLRTIRNTLVISLMDIIFGFPIPILLALMINEVRNNGYKKIVQTMSYLPHFISVVVVCSLILDFTATDGVINEIRNMLGMERVNYMMQPEWFRIIFVGTNIWQHAGWNSIIYLSAISAVDVQLYESALIDGAGRLRRIWSITLPSIVPTIVIMLILRIGGIMSVGFEKIILLYNPLTYETADVISSFVYRRGLQDLDYSFSAAVGLFNSVINFCLVLMANLISQKLTETSLW